MQDGDKQIIWTHEFDRIHALFGIPSIFTLTHEGELHLDVKRTRDFYKHNPHWISEEKIENQGVFQHLIAIDQTTKIPQYLLVSTTHSCSHPQFQIFVCHTFTEAMEQLQKYKTLAFEEHRKRIELQNKDV